MVELDIPHLRGEKKSNIKVLVAMSGGVDSSVAAMMLKKSGYDVVGVTLQLYNASSVPGKSKACCGIKDIHDARTVASQIDIPHYVMDYESVFKQEVIERFADDYLSGSTPIPCIRCNQSVKFRDLLKIAKEIKADAMVTGHYVRRVLNDGLVEMHKAVDETKDQSYFLFSTTQDQLNYLHFPLGEYKKEDIRKIAKEFGLSVSEKKDSQDICFVPNGDYVSVIQSIRPGAIEEGDILHIKTNEKLGRHNGLIRYTIGQRKGIGVSYSEPLYVVKMDFEKHILYIGEESCLYNFEFEINELNLFESELTKAGSADVDICLRALQPTISGRAEVVDQGKVLVKLYDVGGRAITKGQACVMYNKSRIIGGGIINKICS